ncbi:MAG: SDR family oxidoreductase [Flavobacteriales bacterium]|nr:SDR family oxidoreductase [Flavobacteriales bacterium]
MKFVITGALGHIGSYVLRQLPLAYPDCDIVLLDNLMTQRYSSLFNLPSTANYQFQELDVTEENLEPYIEGADFVLHLAAITNAAGSFSIQEEVESNNFRATKQVASACIQESVPLLHLSSTSVYGTQEETVAEDCSESELQPQSPYAETKLREEKYLGKLAENSDLKYVICRFGTICGSSQGMRFHTAVNKFCWQAVMRKPITVWKTALHQKRPYLALNDAFQAINFIVEKNLFNGEIYNVLTDNLTVNDIVEMIKIHVPDLNVEFVETEIMNQLSYEVEDKKIRNCGLELSGSVGACIKETIELLEGIQNSHGQ